jgi:hypothetical protein
MKLFERFTGARIRSAANLVAAIFILASAVMPLTHHSIECHRKSLAHCTACTVGSSTKAPHVSIAPAEVRFVDAGAVVASTSATPDIPTLCGNSDRAPPPRG